jgi:hypothetical protein
MMAPLIIDPAPEAQIGMMATKQVVQPSQPLQPLQM